MAIVSSARRSLAYYVMSGKNREEQSDQEGIGQAIQQLQLRLEGHR